jgi:hypothetical protein
MAMAKPPLYWVLSKQSSLASAMTPRSATPVWALVWPKTRLLRLSWPSGPLVYTSIATICLNRNRAQRAAGIEKRGAHLWNQVGAVKEQGQASNVYRPEL